MSKSSRQKPKTIAIYEINHPYNKHKNLCLKLKMTKTQHNCNILYNFKIIKLWGTLVNLVGITLEENTDIPECSLAVNYSLKRVC